MDFIPGGPELLVLLFIIALLFGASRLPKLARSIGESARELKAGLKEEERGEEENVPKYCPSCGTQIEGEARFCKECGIPLKALDAGSGRRDA